jgi:hypothetical protein
MSNEKKINDLISKKYIKYLFVLLIIYFIYQNYNFVILVIFLLIIIFLNINVQEKFVNNKYLNNYENFKNLITEYFDNYTNKKTKEKFSNNIDNKKSYDFIPFTENENESNNERLIKSTNNDIKEEKSEKNIEPFKTEVLKLKELYENIKLEITKLK